MVERVIFKVRFNEERRFYFYFYQFLSNIYFLKYIYIVLIIKNVQNYFFFGREVRNLLEGILVDFSNIFFDSNIWVDYIVKKNF